jgi:hypothetical protein
VENNMVQRVCYKFSGIKFEQRPRRHIPSSLIIGGQSLGLGGYGTANNFSPDSRKVIKGNFRRQTLAR